MTVKKLGMNIVPGSILSEKAYYKVVKATKKKVTVVTDSGDELGLDRQYVEQNMSSSSSFNLTEEVTRTELAHVVLTNPGIAMALSYYKKPSEKEISDKICDLYPNKGGKMASKADFVKSVNSTLSISGEERVIYGRHEGHLNEQGRLSFIDMDLVKDPSKVYDNRTRLVDTRTINWVTVGGVMYLHKK